MENEYKDVDLNNEVDTDVEINNETEVEAEQETREARPQETLEARRARLQRQLEQTERKLGITNEVKEVKQKVSKTSDFDLGEKAFLIANGVKGQDETELAKRIQRETGRDIESLLETNYFQQELKDLRENKMTQDAIPRGSKRSVNSSVDSVDYWVAKGELPPTSDVEMRRKVVNARIQKEKAKGVFYNS